MAKYRFIISFDGESQTVYPTYGKDTLFVTEREPEQVFYRKKLNNKLTFQRQGFHMVLNAPFDTEYILIIQELDNEGNDVGEAWEGVFYRTDCDIDKDNTTLTVQPEPNDRYKAILEGLDKEIDLIKLMPISTQISYKKQPLIQVYLKGAELISNYLGGIYWETPVTPVTNETELTDSFKFSKGFDKIIVTGSEAGLTENVSGIYDGNTKVREDGVYTLFQDPTVNTLWYIRRNSDGTNVFFSGAVGDDPENLFGFPQHSNYNRTFANQNIITEQVRAFRVEAYVRVLTDIGENNSPVPDNDIVSGLGYKYVSVLNTSNFALSDTKQEESGRYGQFSSDAVHNKDAFFPVFYHPTEGKAYPVLRSTWTEYAIWFYYDDTIRSLQESLGVQLERRVTYKIENVIAVLLKEIDTTLSHFGSANFSNFLYGFVNPVSNVAEPKLSITPNSNITVGNYDQPAQKAIITLREVFEMLKGVYKLAWFIEGDNLRLEHSSFFENGGSYSQQIIGTDLTELIEPKHEKLWSYHTPKYKFEKSQMPEQIRYKWQNNVSEPFEGFPIEIISNFVEKGNIKEVSIAKFTSDIDYMQAIPNEIATDGFALIGINNSSVPFFNIEQDSNNTWKAQNGQLSFIYLHDKFHRHSLPASKVKINEQEVTASSIERNKLQELTFPSDNQPNPMQLVRSALGNGKIDKLQRNLSSKIVKATLRHDTES